MVERVTREQCQHSYGNIFIIYKSNTNLNIQMQLIIACHIDNHWVTCRVCLLDWHIELYDSLSQKLDDQTNLDRRDQQLRPLRRLLPKLLDAAEYWTKSGRPETYEELPLTRMPSDVQTDEVNCGVYACMYARRLLTGTPSIEHGVDVLRDYREQIAWGIYSLSNFECAFDW